MISLDVGSGCFIEHQCINHVCRQHLSFNSENTFFNIFLKKYNFFL